MGEPIVVKKAPVVIIKTIIVAEFFATTLYFVVGLLADYGALYGGFFFSHTVSYEIARFLLKIVVELGIFIFAFLRWYVEQYSVYPEKVIHERGIFLKHKVAVPLRRPVSVSYEYGLLSRIFKCATIVIRDTSPEKAVSLQNISTPRAIGKMIADQNFELQDSASAELTPENIARLLKGREHEELEFKSSMRWDTKENHVNRALEKTALKSVAAFLNSRGGHLVLGVDNAGSVTGLEHDYKTLPRSDADGFENHFNNLFREAIGPEFRRFVRLTFHPLEGKEICVMKIVPSLRPVYMKMDNSEMFYIRTGNSSTPLQLSQIAGYTKSRFQDS